METEKKTRGVKTTYTKEIADSICEQLSIGVPLREICRQEGYPKWRTVYDWLAKDEEFAARFAHARDVGHEALAQECLDIADNAENDWMLRENKDGSESWQLNGEHVQRSKLRIETRLKLLSKWNPKKYGDKVTLAGDEANPIVTKTYGWQE